MTRKENLGKNVKHISSLSLQRVKVAEVFSHGEILLGSANSWLFGENLDGGAFSWFGQKFLGFEMEMLEAGS